MARDFEWTIENQVKFEKSLAALQKHTQDFRIPFRLIASDFYRSQKIIFKLKSAGLYDDLGGFNREERVFFKGIQTSRRNKAKILKKRRTGFIYPILRGENRNLENSTTTRTHRHSIFFLGRQELQMGTNTPYARFHQDGTKFIPQRKFVFIDGGAGDKSRGSGINGRRERWKSIVQDYIKQLVTGRV